MATMKLKTFAFQSILLLTDWLTSANNLPKVPSLNIKTDFQSDPSKPQTTTMPSTTTVHVAVNCSATNSSCSRTDPFFLMDSVINNKKAFVVLSLATLLIIIFFIVNFVRMRSKHIRKRKYDKRSSKATSMEMKRLEDDDEDEDWMVFDATQAKYAAPL